MSPGMDREESTVEREATSQGDHWRTVHHGYFADEEVSRPLVDAIAAAMVENPPDVVADLGGGTGFVLGEDEGEVYIKEMSLVEK